VVNTCAFILDARKEAIETILAGAQWKEKVPGRKLFVVGCLPQRYMVEVKRELLEVDGFFGVGDYSGLVEAITKSMVQSGRERFAFTPRHYRYLRIADGCNRSCSYCAIPLIRGAYRSVPTNELLKEASVLASQGAKEIILIAQELNSYGCDLKDSDDLISLLRGLARIDEIDWIRLLYLHPPLIDFKFIEYIATESKICPYFDFPIEHINDKILSRMGRRITRAEIIERLEWMRELLPHCAIRTSLMVGFPGEGEREFRELADFIAEGWFDRLGVFTYSPEAGTKAYKLRKHPSHSVAEARRFELMEMQRGISLDKNHKKIGSTLKVLIDERNEAEQLAGRTVYEAPEVDGVVILTGEGEIGAMVNAVITSADEYDLYGEIL
jgi:ribosomal protein S12 methylthiotransferase